ncbi:MAG: reverse transcriptase family protein [Gammaproteobacteria bacterium]|nr:reverse transcriptase family protein [Gammaproteobacteria bacterium]
MKAPPLLVSFSSIDSYISALNPALRFQYETEIRALFDKGLPPVVSASCLALLFGYSVRFVNAMCLKNHRYFREFTIKQGKKTRLIKSPKVSIKVIQKWFGTHLASLLTVEDYVYGFTPGKSAVQAASKHCNARWIYSVDIKNFFSSTTDDIIKSSLLELGYSRKAVELIVPLCCFGHTLAQGSPSSPVISNLVMRATDSVLFSLSEKYGATFTRYADDIVFSGRDEFPVSLKEELKGVFENTCWKLSPSKEYFADSAVGQRLKVHGLLVAGSKVRLTKGYRNKLRAYRFMTDKGKVSGKDHERMMGHISYADSVARLSEQ